MPQDSIWSAEKINELQLPESFKDSVITATTQLSRHEEREQFERLRDKYSGQALPYALLLLLGIWILIRLIHGRSKFYVSIGSKRKEVNDNPLPVISNHLTYEGKNLEFAQAELIRMLNKRMPYFSQLTPFEKERFITRLQKFINCKTFKIHDDSGFKEMPVLISASAIQLSFGLRDYLLDDFTEINIFPSEFIGTHPTLRLLEGNVSGNSINISWKHFLNGFELPGDGQNVGLHEMAHAYYCQNFSSSKNNMNEGLQSFNHCGQAVFHLEQQAGNNFYTEYAMQNFQEFWAESVEIYFEKASELYQRYPQLYHSISKLLNQDILNLKVSGLSIS